MQPAGSSTGRRGHGGRSGGHGGRRDPAVHEQEVPWSPEAQRRPQSGPVRRGMLGPTGHPGAPEPLLGAGWLGSEIEARP